MKLSDFDFLFKLDPMQCAGYPKNLNEFLMKIFPEKEYRIGREVRAYEAIYDKFLLGEITDFKTEWAKAININPEIIPNELVQIDKQGIELFTRKVNDFEKSTNGLPILLLASPDEDDFDLVSWYSRLGYIETSFVCEDGLLMIKI
jgi:hypothetical protein